MTPEDIRGCGLGVLEAKAVLTAVLNVLCIVPLERQAVHRRAPQRIYAVVELQAYRVESPGEHSRRFGSGGSWQEWIANWSVGRLQAWTAWWHSCPGGQGSGVTRTRFPNDGYGRSGLARFDMMFQTLAINRTGKFHTTDTG